MSLTLYTASISVFIRQLGILTKLLKIGEDHAIKNNIDPQTLLDGKLAEDMRNLVFQVRAVSDASKGFAWRVAGLKNPSMEDNEKTFADLYSRIDRTVDFLKTVDPAAINGKEETPVQMGERNFVGQTLLLYVALPNIYFHVVTAYNIMRHFGVPLGKMDYLDGRK